VNTQTYTRTEAGKTIPTFPVAGAQVSFNYRKTCQSTRAYFLVNRRNTSWLATV